MTGVSNSLQGLEERKALLDMNRRSQEGVLLVYIETELMQGSRSVRAIEISRRAIKALGLVGIGFARIGVVMICINGSAAITGLPNNSAGSLALAIPNIVGSTVAFGAVSIYSTFGLINETIRHRSPEERVLLENSGSKCEMAVIACFSVLAGLLTQVPFAFATYKTAMFTPVFLGFTQFLDSGRASYSTYMTLGQLRKVEKPLTSQFDQVLLEIRQGFVKAVLKTQAGFQHDTEQRGSFLVLLKSLEESEKKDGLVYISSILEFRNESSQSKPPLSPRVDKAIDVAALLMAGALLAELWQLAGLGAEALLPSSDAFHWIASVLVTAANSHLWVSLIRKSSKYTVNFLRGANPPSIAQSLRPRLHSIATKVGTACAGLTFVGSIYFAKVGFEALSDVAYYTIASLATAGSTMGAVAAVHSLRDRAIRSLETRSDKQLLLVIDEKLGRFANLLSQVPLQKIGDFLKNLSPERREKFLDFSGILKDSNTRMSFLNTLDA